MAGQGFDPGLPDGRCYALNLCALTAQTLPLAGYPSATERIHVNPSRNLEKCHEKIAKRIRENTKLGACIWSLGEPRNKESQNTLRDENSGLGEVWGDISLGKNFPLVKF